MQYGGAHSAALRSALLPFPASSLPRELVSGRHLPLPEAANRLHLHSRKQFMKHLQRADIDCGLGMELEVLDYGSRNITAQLTVQGD